MSAARRQTERRAQRISHAAYTLVVMATGAPKDLIPHHFGRRRGFPPELNGSSRWRWGGSNSVQRLG